MDVKICRICKTEKSVEEFYTRKYKSGRVPDSKCKECAKQQLNNIVKNPEKVKISRKNLLKRKSENAKKIKIPQNLF